ncbi:MAG: SusC/RagA family TonB-linked outer membrane protein [Bacteroidales bacterium]|nr:SusC/RagA family TonB-linked outer membrane protein [Bacteroidales bacterium]
MKKICLTIATFVFVACHILTAQNMKISGTVTEVGTGAPMPYVTIMVKGSTTGTTSADDGSYTINAPAEATLVFSFIGYKTLEIPVNGRNVVNSQLEFDALSLDEVVMVAYGTAKKSSVTGSIASVNSASIEKRPVTNALAALAGSAPGIQVNTASGQPGTDPAIRIRGFGSINYSSEPLIVLDGSPYNGVMANINPADIESINILKDAASTALFGSRGSNGVVMITTKKGRKEKLSVSANITQGFSQRGLPEYDRIDAFDYYPVMWESLRNSLINTDRTKAEATLLASGATANGIVSNLGYNPFRGIANDQVVDTDGKLNPAATSLLWGNDLDWYSPIERVGHRTDAMISASGGTEAADYYLSVGYTTDNGWMKKTNYDRISARANINFTPKNWLKFGVNLNASYNTSSSANTANHLGYANPIYFARSMGPIYPVYRHNRTNGEYVTDDNGNKLWDLGASVVENGVTHKSRAHNNGRHAIAEHLLNIRDFQRNTIQSRAYAEFTFLKDFKFKLQHSFDINNYLNSEYENSLVGDGAPQGRSRKESSLRYTWTSVQMLTYEKTIAKHDFNVMAAHESYKNEYNYLNGFRQGEIISGNTELINFTTTNSLYSYLDRHRVEGYLSRATYSYDNGRYTAEASFRRDGSSKFSNDVRWGNFWSVGGGWRIDKENFMVGQKWVDYLKLRASYGLNGNDGGISNYAWQILYRYRNNAAELGYIQDTAPGNPLLKWETTVQTDIGLEFNLFSNRMRGSIDWFNKESKDLIFSMPLAPTTGYVSQDRNIGVVYNRGWELDLTAGIIDVKNFSFNLNLNATTYKNRIKALPEANRELGIIANNSLDVPLYKRVEGGSIYDYWLRKWYGVDPSNGDALYYFNDAKDANGAYLMQWNEADCKTLGDGTLVTSNQAKAKYGRSGTSIPKVFGSVTPIFKIYGIDVSVQFNYSIGGKTFDYGYSSLMSTGGMGSAKHVDILNRWTTPGQITNVPRMDNARTTDFNASSDRWLVSSSYLSLRNINIAYSFNPDALKSLNIKALKVYASAENLALITARKGIDPTQNFDGNILNDVGFNRIFTFGVNINF